VGLRERIQAWSTEGLAWRLGVVVSIVILGYLWFFNPTSIDWANTSHIIWIVFLTVGIAIGISLIFLTILTVGLLEAFAAPFFGGGDDSANGLYLLIAVLIVLVIFWIFFLPFAVPSYIFYGVAGGLITGLVMIFLAFFFG
jgi:hypothetical protein